MRTIWKQELQADSKKNDVHLCKFIAPAGARPVSVGLQHGKVCLWYECDPTRPTCETQVLCVGTGFGAVPEGTRFIGSVVDGEFVWHFYTDTM